MRDFSTLQPFATPGDLSSYTQGEISEKDDRALPVLAAVSNSIRAEAGWHIGPVIAEELTLDGPGGRLLYLPTMHLVQLHSLTELGRPFDPDRELDWSEQGLVVKHPRGYWTDRYRKIQVRMEHGFASTPDILWLTCSLAARGLSSPMGATREQAGSMSINWATPQQGVGGGLVPLTAEQSVMDRYKLLEA